MTWTPADPIYGHGVGVLVEITEPTLTRADEITARIQSLTFQRNAASDVAEYQIKRADRLEVERNNWRFVALASMGVAVAFILGLIAEVWR